MTVRTIAAERSRTAIMADPEIHTLNIRITHVMNGGEKPYKSRTFDSVTFDFDPEGVLRNIEMQISARTTTRASLTRPFVERGYYVVTLAEDEWPPRDEQLFYDAEKRIACVAFDGELLPAAIYRMSDELAVSVTEGGALAAVWLFNVDFSAFAPETRL